VTWWKRTYEHRPLRPGEDPAAEDLSNMELANSSGMQNVVSVFGFSALLLLPVAWVLGKLKQRWDGRRS
jgi:hypothetical protein